MRYPKITRLCAPDPFWCPGSSLLAVSDSVPFLGARSSPGFLGTRDFARLSLSRAAAPLCWQSRAAAATKTPLPKSPSLPQLPQLSSYQTDSFYLMECLVQVPGMILILECEFVAVIPALDLGLLAGHILVFGESFTAAD